MFSGRRAIFEAMAARIAARLVAAVSIAAVAGCGSTQRRVAAAHTNRHAVYCLVSGSALAPTTRQERTAIARKLRALVRSDSCGAEMEALRLSQALRASKTVPDVIGERLDRAQAELRADGLHFGIGYGGIDVEHGAGPADGWTVCGSSPAPGQLLIPPSSGPWLMARHACIR